MRSIGLVMTLCLLTWGPALADLRVGQPGGPPGLLCRQAIAAAARANGVPLGLMTAIGQVESGRRDPSNGVVQPWPWTINADGQGSFFDTAAQAIAVVQGLLARGVRSIDVGCMQINLLHHPNAFTGLEQAFDPTANADYAARFLVELRGVGGDWPKAAGLYHSATPELGAAYQQKVMALWSEGDHMAGLATRLALAHAWGATLNPGGFPPPLRRGAGNVLLSRSAPDGGSPPTGRSLDSYRMTAAVLKWRR